MKIFATILLATVALTSADVSSLPQSSYNYHPQPSIFPPSIAQQQQQHHPLIMQILAGAIQQQAPQHQSPQYHTVSQPSQQYLPQRYQSPLPSSFPMPTGFPEAPAAAPVPTRGGRRYRPRVKIPKKPIVTKNFFIHSAPEENDEDIQEELSQLAQQPRKHYNVLFVKTPSQTSKAAAVNLAKALKEEKTVVYVLSKKTTATDLQDAISEAPQHINKPEVFFIKYRTPEEAAHAQRQIQTQYDSLGGTSTITDEGIAPITSVVGTLDAPEEEEIDEQQQLQQGEPQQQEQQNFDGQLVNGINNIAGGNPSGNNNQYLPPSQF